MGKEHLSQLVVYAEMIGTCVSSCPGKGEEVHAPWYLTARASSFGRAALRLIRIGFFDEAPILARSIGEITNLFSMFSLSPEMIEEWKKSGRAYRLDKLSPGKNRKRIHYLGMTVTIETDGSCFW